MNTEFFARYSEFYFETEVELWRPSWQTASLIFKQTRKQLKKQLSFLARNTSKIKLSTKRFANYSLPKKSKLDFERYSRQNEANSEYSHFQNKVISVYLLCKLRGLRTLPKWHKRFKKLGNFLRIIVFEPQAMEMKVVVKFSQMISGRWEIEGGFFR